MKRLLYISFGDANVSGRGVTKKINYQLKAFHKAGIETVFLSGYSDRLAVYRGNCDSKPEIIKFFGGIRQQLSKWLSLHSNEFDYAYIRFQFFDFYFCKILETLKSSDARIVVEIPTYPYINELKLQGIVGASKIAVDKIFRNACIKCVDAFCAPAYEGKIFNKEAIPLRNGIEVETISPRKPINDGNKQVRLLAVASMSPWHGFERLIEGLGTYYKNGGKREVLLNLVGEGVELEHYKSLAVSLALQDRIVFQGRLSGMELEHMYNVSEIGICSLGYYKTEITKTNTLKTLEYLAKGMPIVCEENEIGIAVDNMYRLNVPSDNSPIDIDNVINFYDSIYSITPEETVISTIRTLCKEQCSIEVAMREVVKFILYDAE